MLNTGIIAKSEGGILTIVFDRPEACGECHACNRGSEQCQKHVIELRGSGNPGDRVEVEIDDSHVVLASALAYMIPLIGLIAGLAAGYGVSTAAFGRASEPVMAVFALLGTVLGYLLMRALNPRFARGRWQPRIVSVTPSDAKADV